MNYNELLGNILLLGAFLVTLGASCLLQYRYRKYKAIKPSKDITGAEAARMILKKNGLEKIYVVETKGHLSDHYDPTHKVIRLSPEVYREQSLASIAVAAHECGHALQDKEQYLLLRVRSLLVPFTNFSTKFGYAAVLIGLLFSAYNIAWIGIGLLVFILLFQLVTLPVEIDASDRALGCLKTEKMIKESEIEGVQKMLGAAALTYVASLVTIVADLFRLILIVIANDHE